jgi:hypothetical protein
MKNAEFTELLNLYLDQEISAADSARLESEVLKNPERRRVYQQYCQMQKACKMLAADFQAEPVSEPGRLGKKVVAFESAGSGRKPLQALSYTVGAVAAAAACVAVIFSGRGLPGGPDGATAAQDQVAIQVPMAPSSPPADLPAVTGVARGHATDAAIVHRTMLVSDPLLLGGTPRATVEFGSAAAEASDELAWVRTLQLAPVQSRVLAEDLHFDTRPAALRTDARVLGGSHVAPDASSEMNAFRFVK